LGDRSDRRQIFHCFDASRGGCCDGAGPSAHGHDQRHLSDPHEAVVPNARVVVINKAQGVSRETSSNADGLYVFANLPAGGYDLKIQASGFAPMEFKEVIIQAGRTTTLDARLQVAGVGAMVNVSEGAGEIQRHPPR